MSKELNITGLTVLKIDRNGKTTDIVNAALAQKSSLVPSLSEIPHDDAAMHAKATHLQTTETNFKATPPTATKAQRDAEKNAIADDYDENASFIQGVARKEARLAGDVNVGINIVKMAGYKLKDPKGAMLNAFDVQPDGEGAVKIKTKAVGPRTTYIRQFGKAPAKNVEPPKANLEELLISTENDIRVENLESGACYAFREATIVPISRKSDSATPSTNVEKLATPSKATKAHRRVFVSGESHYKFGQWIWRVIQ
ncbi:MAG: hypothetical protein WCH34_08270 [Bacteroidota bacterium]